MDAWASAPWFEPLAVALSLAAVALAVRPYALNWPVAMIGTAMYFLIFRNVKLYSDMLLQLVFLGLQIFGWWQWSRRKQGETLAITRIAEGHWPRLALFTLAGWLAWTFAVISIRPDAAMPWLDGLTAALSVLAIVLQARKKLENWWIWILADLIYIPLYLNMDLPWTAALYAVFVLIAVTGERNWRRQITAASSALS